MAISYLDNIYNFDSNEYLNPSIFRYGNLQNMNAATSVAVPTDNLKSQLNITYSDEDTLLTSYIKAATIMAEQYCQRHFIKETYRIWFNELPSKFSLYFTDVTVDYSSIDDSNKQGLHYLASAGSNYTYFNKSNYYLKPLANPSIVCLKSKPSDAISVDDLDGSNSGIYYFEFKTGFGAVGDIPQAIKQAILLIASEFYTYREDRKRAFPMASQILLHPYKNYY